MRIFEIYRSIQGESSYAGYPCTFVRTAGCSLRCVYCDTGYALPYDSGQKMTLERIAESVKQLGTDLVEITGGDPMEQEDTPQLCRMLLDLGAKVLIETGGHVSVQPLPKEVVKILDIKTPGSRMLRKYNWDNLRFLNPHDEIKFVICSRPDFEWSVNVCREHRLPDRHVVHFSPCFDAVANVDLANWILADNIPVRLQLQQHKYIWSPSARGV